jgi:hypothetical protein
MTQVLVYHILGPLILLMEKRAREEKAGKRGGAFPTEKKRRAAQKNFPEKPGRSKSLFRKVE